MQQTSSARRALADTDEALARLAAGRFGRCENCAAPIPARTLRTEPEARYCAHCAEPALMGAGLSVVTA
jgi:RNA polymerase-binding transcription factor DksA